MTPADVLSMMLKQLYAGDESCLLFASSVQGSHVGAPRSKKAAKDLDAALGDAEVGGRSGRITQNLRTTRKSNRGVVQAVFMWTTRQFAPTNL